MEFTLPKGQGYIMLDGSLTFITPKSVEIVGEELTFTFTDPDGRDLAISRKQSDAVPFYESPESFEKDEQMKMPSFSSNDIIVRNLVGDRRNKTGLFTTSDTGLIQEIKPENIHIRGIWDEIWKFETVEKVYVSQQEWCKYNDYSEINANGLEIQHLSYKTLMAFSDEEKKAIKSLQDAFTKCEKLGMSFVMDTDSTGIRVYNTKFVNSFHTVPKYDFDDEDKQCDSIEGLYEMINANMHYYNCDYSVLVKRGAGKSNN